jgi:hypothetical protein|tara:strand:- start:59 stop:418 length:360 start_codon:yes stop_codon:yes gene_type:complete
MERHTSEINICLGHAHFLSLNFNNVFEDHPHYDLQRLLINDDYYSGIGLTWTRDNSTSSELSRLESEYAVISNGMKNLKEVINEEGIAGDQYLTLKAEFDQFLIDISVIERQIVTLRDS